jgi:hypothetical protein
VHLALLEQLVQIPVGFGVFSEQDDTARLFVQTVDDKKLLLACFGHQLEKGYLFAVALGNRGELNRLVDGDEIVIFKENGNRMKFGDDSSGHVFPLKLENPALPYQQTPLEIQQLYPIKIAG